MMKIVLQPQPKDLLKSVLQMTECIEDVADTLRPTRDKYEMDIDRAIRAGAQAYLVKPNGLEEIVPMLEQLQKTAAAVFAGRDGPE